MVAGKKGDRFCCLGVLCDLAVRAKVIPPPNAEDVLTGESYEYDGEDSFLPPSVQDWAGLRSNDGNYELKNGKELDLAGLNDQGKKFKTIAKIIKSAPEGLFV